MLGCSTMTGALLTRADSIRQFIADAEKEAKH
jgi:hypothetical protein